MAQRLQMSSIGRLPFCHKTSSSSSVSTLVFKLRGNCWRTTALTWKVTDSEGPYPDGAIIPVHHIIVFPLSYCPDSLHYYCTFTLCIFLIMISKAARCLWAAPSINIRLLICAHDASSLRCLNSSGLTTNTLCDQIKETWMNVRLA